MLVLYLIYHYNNYSNLNNPHLLFVLDQYIVIQNAMFHHLNLYPTILFYCSLIKMHIDNYHLVVLVSNYIYCYVLHFCNPAMYLNSFLILQLILLDYHLLFYKLSLHHLLHLLLSKNLILALFLVRALALALALFLGMYQNLNLNTMLLIYYPNLFDHLLIHLQKVLLHSLMCLLDYLSLLTNL